MTDKRDRTAALAHVAERVLELNDAATDPTFDALIALADESEASPSGVRDAAHRALRAAGKRVPAAR